MAHQAERWQELRETMALVLVQAATALAVAVACVGVVYSALEPLVARCGAECERLHAQLGLYMLAAAAAVPLLVLTAVALARRPSTTTRQVAWLSARVLAVAALAALTTAVYALLAHWVMPPTLTVAASALTVAVAYTLAHRFTAEEPRQVR